MNETFVSSNLPKSQPNFRQISSFIGQKSVKSVWSIWSGEQVFYNHFFKDTPPISSIIQKFKILNKKCKNHLWKKLKSPKMHFEINWPQKSTKSSPSIWHLIHNVKSIFVAFSENMNFNSLWLMGKIGWQFSS